MNSAGLSNFGVARRSAASFGAGAGGSTASSVPPRQGGRCSDEVWNISVRPRAMSLPSLLALRNSVTPMASLRTTPWPL